MKKERIKEKLRFIKERVEGKVGKNYIVIYYQEGKRLSYYSGNYLSEKRGSRLYYRKMDRSNQKFLLKSPHLLLEL